ncbi:Xylose isomerase-like TIM barrel [Planctomycetes bacterium Pan216]|uniref:Xylose isomerase-like TIM barrel n=1 Tax=Kolteria novifilia TaxID=2527975 RepID=A0A518B831_9BACT|nr:Xylose isomerase-like TIM barrel [Planctomycetes bacterium Pan216]
MNTISRRHLMANTLGAIGTASLLRPEDALGIEPIKRVGKSVVKLSLAAYSFRNQLAPKGGTPSLDLLGFIDYCSSLRLDGTELTSYYFAKEITNDYLGSLKRRAFVNGLGVSGGAIRNDFCQPDGEKRKQDIAHTKQWVDHYAMLGCPAIRIFAGNVPKGSSKDEAIGRCVEGIEECCEHAAKKGVFLALENHGGITATSEDMLKIVKQVKSPWFGVNLDTGNFARNPAPYDDLAAIAPYAVNVQFKVSRHTQKHMGGEAEYLSKCMRIIQDANYSGWLALEYEASEDPYRAIPPLINKLRASIG